MTTKINIFGLLALMVLFAGVGLFFGYLIGDNSATERYREDYEAQSGTIDSIGFVIDTFKMKQDTLENLIDKKCNENIKKEIAEIRALRKKPLLHDKKPFTLY